MLQTDKAIAKIASFNPRAEKHGEDNKLAADIKVQMSIGNGVLDQFHPDLRAALYRKAGPGEQQDLIDGENGLVAVKFPRIGALRWDEEFPGYEVTIHSLLGLVEPQELVDVTLKKFAFEPIEGGSVALTFSIVFHPDKSEAGALCALIQEEVELTLVPPKAQAQQQPDLADVA